MDLRGHPSYGDTHGLSFDIDGRRLPAADTRQIELIDIRDELHTRLRCYFGEALPSARSLAYLEVDRGDSAGDRCAYDETVKLVVNNCKIAAQNLKLLLDIRQQASVELTLALAAFCLDRPQALVIGELVGDDIAIFRGHEALCGQPFATGGRAT